jgi:hypothetical protein
VLAAEYCRSGQHPDNGSADLEAKMDDQNGSATEGPANASEGPANALEGPAEATERRPHSAVTSGRKLLLQGDVHSIWARRYRDVIACLTNDLGGRGMIGEAKASLIRDCAALEVVLEKMRGHMSAGQNVDAEAYARIAAHRRRLLETLGLERVARNVTPPTLEHFLGSLKPEE